MAGKGATGELEIVKMLNPIVHNVRRQFGHSEKDITNPHVQVMRNYSQSALGGNDIVNAWGLSIEVKRQQVVSVDRWWRQSVKAAEPLGLIPVLMYRRNSERWHVVMNVHLPGNSEEVVRAEILPGDFLVWFEQLVISRIKNRKGA